MWPFKKRPKKIEEPVPAGTPPIQPEAQETPPVAVPPVNLNEAVTNPALVDAIAAFNASPSHENDKAVMVEISRANFLVATMIDSTDIDPSETQGQVTIKGGGRIGILSCTDPNGVNLLPLFTDWPAITAFTDQKVTGLVMPAAQAWTVTSSGYGGVIINPAGERVKLTLDVIQKYFLSQPVLSVVPESIELQVRPVKQIPIEVANKLHQYCVSNGAVKSCILLDARKPDSDESELKLLINLGLGDGSDFNTIAKELLEQIKDHPNIIRKAMVLSDSQYERYLPDALYVKS